MSGEGKTIRVVSGKLYGERSPLPTLSDTIFADATLTAGSSLPVDAETEERALYLVSGEIEIAGDRFASGQLLVLRPGDAITVNAERRTRCAGRRRRHGWSAPRLVELRLLAQGPYRAGQGRLETRPFRYRAGR